MRTSSASRAQPANAAANYGRFGNADHMGRRVNQELAYAYRCYREWQGLNRRTLAKHGAAINPAMEHVYKITTLTLCRIRRAGRLGR